MKFYHLFAVAICLSLSACNAHEQNLHEENILDVNNSQSIINLFQDAPLASTPKIVDCTLSGGTRTTCLSITINVSKPTAKTGPWCPRNISDTADKTGIWLVSGKVHDADGEFVKNLNTFYNDDNWLMYDPETGNIKVTESKAACMAAARPDVDPQYQNHCVECQTDYMDENATITYVIPTTPSVGSKSERLNPMSGVGVSFNGVKYDGPAPTDAILAAHTLAPFDDCGGHVNLHAGYHYHAVMGCTEVANTKSEHAPVVGLAMDGYLMHSRFNASGLEPQDLDECRGHSTDALDYHYHVNEAGKNQIIGCFKAEIGCSLEDPDQTCDASIRRRPPRP